MKLSISNNGENIQWIACSGESTAGIEEIWFGKVVAVSDVDEGEADGGEDAVTGL